LFLDLHSLSCLVLYLLAILELNCIAESTSSITAKEMVTRYHWLQKNQEIPEHDVESDIYCNLKLILSPYISSQKQERESSETAVII